MFVCLFVCLFVCVCLCLFVFVCVCLCLFVFVCLFMSSSLTRDTVRARGVNDDAELTTPSGLLHLAHRQTTLAPAMRSSLIAMSGWKPQHRALRLHFDVRFLGRKARRADPRRSH